MVTDCGGGVGNDACADAEAIGVVTDQPYTTLGATPDGYNPGCVSGAANDIWYVFTAPGDGQVSVDLCGSAYDTGLAFWDACGGNVLACNDDNCGLQSAIYNFPMLTGEMIYIQVTGYGTASGTGDITVGWFGGGGPPNDDCATSIEITGPWPATVLGTTLGASMDCANLTWSHTVWYHFDLLYDATDVVATLTALGGSLTNTGIILMTSCCVDNTGWIFNNGYNFVGATIEIFYDCIALPAGTTLWYPMMVEPQGDFELILDQTECIPCVLDCPPGSYMEMEACGADVNGGCNMDPGLEYFEPITSGVTVCGTYWDDTSIKDTDWFVIDAPYAVNRITIEGMGEVATIFGLLDFTPMGQIDCATSTGGFYSYISFQDCEPGLLVVPYLPTGQYGIWIAQLDWTGNVCGASNDYYFTATVTEDVPPPYCVASGGCDEYITNVTLEDLNNNSACEGYADFTAMAANLEAGMSYDLYIYIGPPYYTSDDIGVWVDWNQDLDFYDTGEEMVCEINVLQNGMYTFAVPAGTPDGAYTMRIRLKWSGDDCGDPCGTTSYGEVEDYTIQIGTAGNPVDFIAMLEGPFAGGGIMNNVLDAVMPLTQPFGGAPWNYGGSEAVGAIPTGVVDWILVEMRDAATDDGFAATGATMVERHAGFIMDNGMILGTDLNPIIFQTAPVGYPFFVLWHRNHLGIMSAVSGQFTYDFSAAGAAWQNGTKDLGGGYYGMIAGDANADGNVDNTDKNDIWVPQAGTAGYLEADFNLNVDVDNVDKNDYWVPNAGGGSQVPGSVVPEGGYKCQVPK
jgi:hypothetical protein